MTNKGLGIKMKDQDRCRSLVCDPSGIIVAEMVYRCMICLYVTDTVIEAREHYAVKHMDDDKEINDTPESFNESDDVNNLALIPQLSGPYYNKYSVDEPMSPDEDNFDRYSPLVTMTEGAIQGSNVNSNGNVTGGKSGYVNCAVCGVTRFYSCVQRRYGQFTCVTCYRYFRSFLLDPKKYACPNLGECLLNVRVRCRACWLKACIDVFTLDLRRQTVVEDFCPVKDTSKSGTVATGLGSGSVSAESDDNNTSLLNQDFINEMSTITVSFNSGHELPSILQKSEAIRNNKLDGKTPKVKVTSGKKIWSCGKCETCMAEDCGKCIYCLDRPKFGGPFIKKQRCIQRRCLMKLKNKTNGNSTC